MSLRHRAEKRAVTPDTRYSNDMVGRLINSMMERGKKSIAERIVYGSFDQIAEATKEDPLQIFTQAIDNVKPRLEVDGDRATGRWDLLSPCTQPDGTSLWMAGYEDDVYARVGGAWLHRSMTLTTLFVSPAGTGWPRILA